MNSKKESPAQSGTKQPEIGYLLFLNSAIKEQTDPHAARLLHQCKQSELQSFTLPQLETALNEARAKKHKAFCRFEKKRSHTLQLTRVCCEIQTEIQRRKEVCHG